MTLVNCNTDEKELISQHYKLENSTTETAKLSPVQVAIDHQSPNSTLHIRKNVVIDIDNIWNFNGMLTYIYIYSTSIV